jgi:serine phosphatase RsbU (regulator of sigma subunit)
MLFWAAACFISLEWNLHQREESHLMIALQSTRSFFQLIVLTRQWNATHGGVFVPITEKMQPNKYLDPNLRDLTTDEGLKLTKINPAFMTRQISEIADAKSGVKFHITSLNPLNPDNFAQPWESEALKGFEKGEKERFYLLDGDEGQKKFQYMAPLITDKTCLKCHAKQGYKEGDVRGGISINMPFRFGSSNYLLWISHLVALATGWTGLLLFNSSIKRSREKILEANHLLEDSNTKLDVINKKMKTDLEIAEKLQKHLFSSNFSSPFLDFATISIPYSHVSGDILEVKQNQDGSCAVFLGDATGHGIAAAFTTIIAKVSIDEFSDDSDLVKLFEYLNERLEKYLPDERYISAIYLRITPEGKLTVINAGHPPLLLKNNSGKIMVQKEKGLLLGLFENSMLNLKVETFELQPGEKCFLMTDGIIEMTNPEGEAFGMERLQKFLAGIDGSPNEILESLCEKTRDFRQESPLNDDLTFVCFEYKG